MVSNQARILHGHRDVSTRKTLRFDSGKRCLLPEWMDDPRLEPEMHRQALAGLHRVNWFSRSGPAVWQMLRPYVTSAGRQPLRILDVACGGGDLTRYLAYRARKLAHSPPPVIAGCDLSPLAIDVARQAAVRAGLHELHYFQAHALEPLSEPYDCITCSLFLHHLEAEQACGLLENLARSARLCVLVDDLRRTRLGWHLARWGTRLLTRSPVVRLDGPQSVAAAFTESEALDLAERAGWTDVTVTRHWPQRFLLHWSRNP